MSSRYRQYRQAKLEAISEIRKRYEPCKHGSIRSRAEANVLELLEEIDYLNRKGKVLLTFVQQCANDDLDRARPGRISPGLKRQAIELLDELNYDCP
jgi:hypothetical protein